MSGCETAVPQPGHSPAGRDGRFFDGLEDAPGGPLVVVSHGFWQ
jgi:hypothetical protein